ncbi:tyrosine-protein phosphatase non-receptor type 9-like [Watersipora subatra]|uniref:tyrosine-protein phosphatase non-receptor type 9-like n=1 Tax=Watersipora subatra TaxID=2589382 RepID=UPI00355B854F
MSCNSSKNRYGDIPCYDGTRVKLNSGDTDATNYINASFVNGYRHKQAYICCQGPLERTCNDFWQMVWQENVRVIVMTTRYIFKSLTKEKGRVKCSNYWPESEHEAHQYKGYFVVNTKIRTSEKYNISSLILRCDQTEKIRLVYHVLFLAWPDYGVPACPDDLLQLIYRTRQLQEKGVKLAEKEDNWAGHPHGPPLIIHCSAGVGRSGTFMCVDICMRMLDEIQKTNIEEIVKALRTQRAFAVQTAKQFIFCHLAVLQYAINTGILPADTKLPDILSD